MNKACKFIKPYFTNFTLTILQCLIKEILLIGLIKENGNMFSFCHR